MRGDPCLLFHVVEPLGVHVAGIRQARHEHVYLEELSGVGIDHLHGVAHPVDLNLLRRLAVDVHGHPVGCRPATIAVAEGRVHVRLLTGGDGGIAILVPEEGHRHAATSHLPFHMLMIDRMLVGVLLGLGREGDSLQRGVIHLLRQRPTDPRGPGPVRHALDRARRASDRESDVSSAHAQRLKPKNLTIFVTIPVPFSRWSRRLLRRYNRRERKAPAINGCQGVSI